MPLEFASAQGNRVRRSLGVNVGSPTPRLSATALSLVLMAHVAVLAALVALRVVPAQMPASALMIDVIRAHTPAPKQPEIPPAKPATTPPKPKPVSPQSPSLAPVEAPVLATQNPTSEAARALAQADKQVALPSSLPSALTPTPPAAQAPAQPASPTTAAQAAPRFDADYLQNPAPSYPPLSRRSGEEGKVVLKVFVEPSGSPSKVEIRTSSSFERLDKSAVAAVSRWKFVPAKQGAEAVGAWVLVPIVFSLKG